MGLIMCERPHLGDDSLRRQERHHESSQEPIPKPPRRRIAKDTCKRCNEWARWCRSRGDNITRRCSEPVCEDSAQRCPVAHSVIVEDKNVSAARGLHARPPGEQGDDPEGLGCGWDAANSHVGGHHIPV